MKNLDLIVMAATRYALPRFSYIVDVVQDFIRENIKDDMAKEKLAAEINEWCDGALNENNHPKDLLDSWRNLAAELSNEK